MQKNFQNETQKYAKIYEFSFFSIKAKMHETIVFTIENVVLDI